MLEFSTLSLAPNVTFFSFFGALFSLSHLGCPCEIGKLPKIGHILFLPRWFFSSSFWSWNLYTSISGAGNFPSKNRQIQWLGVVSKWISGYHFFHFFHPRGILLAVIYTTYTSLSMLWLEEILTPIARWTIPILYFPSMSIFIPMLQDFKQTGLSSWVVNFHPGSCFVLRNNVPPKYWKFYKTRLTFFCFRILSLAVYSIYIYQCMGLGTLAFVVFFWADLFYACLWKVKEYSLKTILARKRQPRSPT